MKSIFGAFALVLAAPAFAQATPPAEHKAVDHGQMHTMGQQPHQHQGEKHDMEAMHKHCQEMMKQHGQSHGAKSGAAGTAAADAQKGHEGHAGH